MSVEAPEAGNPYEAPLLLFTGCIGESLTDICSYGLTIGEVYVPFDPDEDDTSCADDEAICSQAWVRVASINAKASSQPESFDGTDCAIVLQMALEVGVIRCIDIPEGGEAPTESQVLAASMQALDDMNAIFCAAMDCEVWTAISVGTWTPMGPLGGQYGGIWSFTVEV